MEEYLVVHFTGSPRSRRVRIDGFFNGRTGDLIQLEAGTHTVSLGPPANFTPSRMTIKLKDTSELSPLEVIFAKIP